MAVEESAGTESLDLYIAPLGDAAARHAGALARELRKSAVSIEVAADGKLKRAMELANKLGARNVLVVGDDELASGEYSLTNMLSGERSKVRRAQLLDRIGIRN